MSLTITDLFCGAGGSGLGAVAAGYELVMAANHWQKAIDTHAANFPDTEHDCADISQVDPRRYRATDVLWASPECFTAGHLVTTARGQVPIEDVTVGDLALTHMGRWRRVVRVQNRQAATVIAKGQGHVGIETTASHKFWGRPSALAWDNTIRQYRRKYGEPDWTRITDLPGSHGLWATPVSIETLPDELPPHAFGDDLAAAWWLIGRWVGDGSLTFGRNHEVLLTCGFQDVEMLRTKLAETGVAWAESRKRTAMVFSVGDEKARDWLHEHFGHGAANKGIPSWALTMPKEFRAALLDGYVAADGHTSENSVHTSTVSRRLAVSTRLLAEGLGCRVAMCKDKRTTYRIEGRTGIALEQWILTWTRRPSIVRTPEAFADGPHAWSRVRSISLGQDEATVYNIEVAEDHSYVLDGIVVANCTNHSQAKGTKRSSGEPDLFGDVLPDAAAERSRATMWDVPRFTEAMVSRGRPYRAVVVENVVEAVKWAPFPAWLQSMQLLGYEHQIVSLNSMHAPAIAAPRAPQSRDRLYVVFHRAGQRRPDVSPRPAAWCPRCEREVLAVQAWKNGRTVGRYRAQYVYVCPTGHTVEPYALPAAAAIDWTMPGQRIGDRVKPLSPKTMARIEAGLRKYARPFLTEHTHEYRVRELTRPMGTLRASGNHVGLVVPVEGRAGKQAAPVSAPLRTQSTRSETALVVPYYGASESAQTTTQPIGTLTTRDRYALVVPSGGTWRETAIHDSQPFGTVTTRETDGVAFIAELRGGSSDHRPVTEPLCTVTASGNHHMLVRHNSSKGDGGEMCTPTHEPARTLTTSGHQSLVSIEAQVEDATFRMLEPHEIQAAMAFTDTYRVLGNRREKVRQLGNGVTPPAAEWLLGAVARSLDGAA